MNVESLIRRLAIVALVLTAIDFAYGFLAWDWIDESSSELMSLNGFYSIVPMPWWTYIPYYFVQVTVLLALFFSFRFAKGLFVAFTVIALILSLLFGFAVALPFQVFMATMLTYVYGAILALIYLDRKTLSD